MSTFTENKSVRGMLGDRGIKLEELAAEEDLKKLERRAKSSEKKMIKESELPRKIEKRPKKKNNFK
jgi:DNA-damage-inducible protein D